MALITGEDLKGHFIITAYLYWITATQRGWQSMDEGWRELCGVGHVPFVNAQPVKILEAMRQNWEGAYIETHTNIHTRHARFIKTFTDSQTIHLTLMQESDFKTVNYGPEWISWDTLNMPNDNQSQPATIQNHRKLYYIFTKLTEHVVHVIKTKGSFVKSLKLLWKNLNLALIWKQWNTYVKCMTQIQNTVNPHTHTQTNRTPELVALCQRGPKRCKRSIYPLGFHP